MSMFQILLKKGWTDIMYGTMSRAETHAAAAMMAVYFLTYHLLVTVVSVSVVPPPPPYTINITYLSPHRIMLINEIC